MSWSAANSWASGLIYEGYDDWRLTSVSPVNGTAFNYSYSNDGSSDHGYNITSPQSEMSYMFYQNLGNTGYVDTSENTTGCSGTDFCLTNKDIFGNGNLQAYVYWSAEEYTPDTRMAWGFVTEAGYQDIYEKNSEFYAWAVRSGDVSVVPLPAAIWFYGTGLIGFIGLRLRKQR